MEKSCFEMTNKLKKKKSFFNFLVYILKNIDHPLGQRTLLRVEKISRSFVVFILSILYCI